MQIQAEAVQQRDMVVLGHITGGVGGWVVAAGCTEGLAGQRCGDRLTTEAAAFMAAVTPRRASLLLMRCRRDCMNIRHPL